MAKLKKRSLREYQESVMARLRALDTTAPITSRLGIEAAQQFWLLNLIDAGEVVPTPELTAVPLTQPWFCGITNVRGNLYSIVDLAAFMGEKPTPRHPSNRLLLLGSRLLPNSGLLVERVVGLRKLEELEPVNATEENQQWVAQAYKDAQNRIWKTLDLSVLVQDQRFLQVGI